MTIKDSNSIIYYWSELGTEIDGTSTGHGIARVLYSQNNGSYQVHHYYNITGAPDNMVGNGFRGYFNHNFSVGNTVKFKVQYGKNGSGGNHTLADTGPQGSFGGNPVTRFFAFEVNT